MTQHSSLIRRQSITPPSEQLVVTCSEWWVAAAVPPIFILWWAEVILALLELVTGEQCLWRLFGHAQFWLLVAVSFWVNWLVIEMLVNAIKTLTKWGSNSTILGIRCPLCCDRVCEFVLMMLCETSIFRSGYQSIYWLLGWKAMGVYTSVATYHNHRWSSSVEITLVTRT